MIDETARRSASIRLGGTFGALFLYVGVFLPFWAVWLQYTGLTPVEIGLVMTVPYVLKPVIPLISTQLADHIGRVKPIFLANLALTFLLFIPYLFVDSFWGILLVTLFLNLFFQPLMPLLDAMSVKQARYCGMHYGRVRSVGSVTFIITAFLIGLLIKNTDAGWVVPVALACLAVILLVSLGLPPDPVEESEEEDMAAQGRKPLRRLLGDRRFIGFLIVVALIQMSHGVYYTLGSVHWKNNGLDEDIIGMLWGIGVVAEILIFIFASEKIAKIGPMKALMFIALMGVVRWTTLGMTFSLPVLFLVQTIHGLTYGAAHLAAIYYIANRVPSFASSTAQGLYSAVPMGIGMGMTTFLAGILYDGWQGKSYWVMAALCLLAFFIANRSRSVAFA